MRMICDVWSQISATRWPLLKNPLLFPFNLSQQCNLDISRFPFLCISPPLQICSNMSSILDVSKYVCQKIVLVLGSFAERFDASALSALIRNWSVRRARLCIHQKTRFLKLEKKLLTFFGSLTFFRVFFLFKSTSQVMSLTGCCKNVIHISICVHMAYILTAYACIVYTYHTGL